jgi:uncharacterized protein (TIGR03066 family)
MNRHTKHRPWTRQRTPPTEAPDIGTAPQPAAVSSWRGTRLVLILVLCLAGSTAASFVVFKYLIAKVPSDLVGAWEVKEGPLKGWSLEFRRDGTAVATRFERGQKIVTDHTAKVEGHTLWLTTKDEKTGKEDTVTQTIVELSADELVIRDEEQKTYQLKRVSP